MPTALLLVLTAAGFGASPLLIAMAVETFPPWTLAALRAVLGLPILVIAAGVIGQHRRLIRHDLVTMLVGGVLVVAIPFVSMAAGMRFIPSGMGGMLYATMPLFTLGLAAVFLTDEPATWEQGLRIGTGLFGVALIAGPGLLSDRLGHAGLGIVLTLMSPLSYAAGNVWFRRRRWIEPVLMSAGMFFVGALMVWPLALLIDGTPQVAPTSEVVLILLALVVLATVAPTLSNSVLVQKAGSNRAALVMFLMPAFSVVFGWVFRDERLPYIAFFGLALVVGASAAPLPGRLRRFLNSDGPARPAATLPPLRVRTPPQMKGKTPVAAPLPKLDLTLAPAWVPPSPLTPQEAARRLERRRARRLASPAADGD